MTSWDVTEKKERTQRLMGLFKRMQGPQWRESQWPILLQIIRLWLIITHRVGKGSCVWSSGLSETKGERPSSYFSLTPAVLVPLTASRWSVSLFLSQWLFAVNRLFSHYESNVRVWTSTSVGNAFTGRGDTILHPPRTVWGYKVEEMEKEQGKQFILFWEIPNKGARDSF